MEVTFIRENITVEVTKRTTLLELARQNHIDAFYGSCGIKKCMRCKVVVTKGNNYNFNSEELEALSIEERSKGYRLACAYIIDEKMQENIAVMTLEASAKNVYKKTIYKQIAANDFPIVVLDVGTTTLELYVYNCKLECAQMYQQENPLRIFGNDVISRISYASTKDKLFNMRNLLVSTCDKMLEENRHDYNFDEIIVTGNPTMINILTGNDIESLGRAPFKSQYMGATIEENIFKEKVLVPPFIAGQLGADAFCILYKALVDENRKNNSLIMDIGTNSEMFVISGDKIYGCSTAAGPAFEEHSARGLNGSGVVNLIADLLENKKIDEYGTLDEVFDRKITVNTGQEIVSFTQKDIRNIQMAKAAVMAGIKVMLDAIGISEEQLDNIYLAGNFGNNLNLENAIKIGLISDTSISKYSYQQNMAAKGAAHMYKRIKFENATLDYIAKNILDGIEYIDLANSESFKKEYIKQMNFKQ